MDLLTLREELETLLVEELGVYTLANGSTTPAINVRAIGEQSQPTQKLQGLSASSTANP